MTVTWVPMTAQVVATILHPFWCYYFVIVKEMDIIGIGLAYTITQVTLLVFVTCYASFVPEISDAIQLPNADSFREWRAYMKLGIPVMVMLWSEDLAFYGLTLLSGLISVQDQATQVLLVNLNGQMFVIAVGLQEATTVVIGNSIGDGNT